VGGLVVATGKARASFIWNLFASSVCLVAVAFGASYGARGIAWAMLLSTTCILFPCGFFLRWVLIRLPPGPFLACLSRPLAYAGFMGVAVGALVSQMAQTPTVPKLAAGVACGIVVYASLVWSRERSLVSSIREAWA
jgi:hypothetical protein